MDRVCINRSTGVLIEMQSGGDDIPELMDGRLNTLLQNAINCGYKAEEVEVKWVEDASPIPTMTHEEEINMAVEAIIKQEMEEILREQAVARLIDMGVLDV